jgi:thiamine-monophosphate kinase
VTDDDRIEPHTRLASGGEFDVIRRMLERWGRHAQGIGDDAAVISPPAGESLVVSTDASVENVHFTGEWLSPSEIGYRAAAAALSDLAAMGAQPLGMLVAMAIPEHWIRDIDAISDGIGDAARVAGAPILGGDMSRARELSLTFTVLGTARNVLLRRGARSGDHVYVTGRLGGPGAALRALAGHRAPRAIDRARFARPVPRIREALWLAGRGATAAIDISDGLSSDLQHLAAASGVCIKVDLSHVPAIEGISSQDAAVSGEEYEIAVTAPRELDAEEFRRSFDVDLTMIGTVEDGEPGVDFLLGGEPVEVPRGYLHFE